VAELHLLPSQQTSPRSPQSVQLFRPVQSFPGEHAVFTSSHTPDAGFVVSQQPTLQVVPLQHAIPFPPQPAQLPLCKQVSPLPHLVPVARHILVVESQHPVLQTSPVQQGLPGLPQVLHMPPWQAVPVPLHEV
jgi:hypothetical protein